MIYSYTVLCIILLSSNIYDKIYYLYVEDNEFGEE